MTNRYTADEIAAHRREWINTLRSGAYTQTNGRLHDGTSYCCLGVACVLAGIPVRQSDGMMTTPYYYFDDDYLTLPESAMEWLGVTAPNPPIDWGELRNLGVQGREDGNDFEEWPTDAATLNDEGFTFNQIADVIEYFGLISNP